MGLIVAILMETGFKDLSLFEPNPFMESRAMNITVQWITQDGRKEGKATFSQDPFYEQSCKNVKEKMNISIQL